MSEFINSTNRNGYTTAVFKMSIQDELNLGNLTHVVRFPVPFSSNAR